MNQFILNCATWNKARLGSLLNLVHYYVNESIVRVEPRNTVFSGTVRMVGVGQTYTTITAAVTAAVSGDIIQLVDGTYDMKDEAGGYFLCNALTKNLLIRGNALDKNAVTITQTGASTFTFRLYKIADVRVENITFTGTKNAAIIFADWNDASINQKFKNCIFNCNFDGTGNQPYLLGDTNLSELVSRLEFENCTINKNYTSPKMFNLTKLGINFQILLQSVTINSNAESGFNLLDGSKCKLAIYDSTIAQNNDNYIIRIGQDTAAPTQQFGMIDIRNCDLNYATGKGNHAILLGRGTASFYVVNNRISISKVNNLSIGVVIKTISTALPNAILAGNYMTGSRGILCKGASYIKAKWNTAISTDAVNGQAFKNENTPEIDGLIVSEYNEITYNNLIANRYCIETSTAATTPTSKTSFQTCTVDNNKYFKGVGAWAFDGAIHSLPTKETLWTGNANNDVHSKMYASDKVVISSTKKDI